MGWMGRWIGLRRETSLGVGNSGEGTSREGMGGLGGRLMRVWLGKGMAWRRLWGVRGGDTR